MDDNWFENEKLHRAADDGDVTEMRALIAAGRDPNQFDDQGKTPLHYAARNEHVEAVKYLLSVGANVDARDESQIGNTPLGHIAQTCSLKMATLLLEAGANPNQPGWMQITPLHRASKRTSGEGPAVYAALLKASQSRRG